MIYHYTRIYQVIWFAICLDMVITLWSTIIITSIVIIICSMAMMITVNITSGWTQHDQSILFNNFNTHQQLECTRNPAFVLDIGSLPSGVSKNVFQLRWVVVSRSSRHPCHASAELRLHPGSVSSIPLINDWDGGIPVYPRIFNYG